MLSRKEKVRIYEKKLDEIVQWIVIHREKLDGWNFSDNSLTRKVDVGFTWDSTRFPVRFSREIVLSKDLPEGGVYLDLWFGGESLVKLNGKDYTALNEHHRLVFLPSRNEKYIVEAEVVPRGLSGTPIRNPKFEKADLIVKDLEIEKLCILLKNLIAFYATCDDKDLVHELERLIEEYFYSVRLPSSIDVYFRNTYENPTLSKIFKNLWSSPPDNQPIPLPEEYRKVLLRGGEELLKRLRKLKELFPNYGKMVVFGHSHIDYAWLWPFEETRRKILRTFSTMVNFLERFKNFVYVQSSAQMYEDIKEMDPFLYSKIKRFVDEGRWIPIGGTWVESDCNIPSGESLVRQFLYGKRFFLKEYGKDIKIAWFPDTFGYPWTLPKIMKSADVEFFLTTKLTWNELNDFPHEQFLWIGDDGTEIKAINTLGYTNKLSVEEIVKQWEWHSKKSKKPFSVLIFGYGDGGGGPTEEMIKAYDVLKGFPKIPEIIMKDPEDDFLSMNDLPAWDDELYLELHRGTYTTLSDIKKYNRKAEFALYTLELVLTMEKVLEGLSYPRDEIERMWKMLLKNQFHDILPGSSIKEVYDVAINELKMIVEKSQRLIEKGIKVLAKAEEGSGKLVVFNPHPFPVELDLILESPVFKSLKIMGKIIPAQDIFENKVIFRDPDIILNPFSVSVFDTTESVLIPESDLKVMDNIVENEFYKIRINEDGSVNIKYRDRDVFSGEGNVLVICDDVPRNWDAWDVQYDVERSCERIVFENIELMSSGPHVVIYRLTGTYNNSRIEQFMVIRSRSRRIDFITKVDWRERRKILRVLFPVNLRSRWASFDIPYGVIQRPTARNTSWEMAKFEVPAHKWMDLSNGIWGVAVLNDSKYGHSVEGSVMKLSLLRSPVYPYPEADVGKQEFIYSIYIHDGDWRGGVIEESLKLNLPLIPMEIKLAKEVRSFLKVDGAYVTTVKMAEDGDGVIVRLVDYSYNGGRVSLEPSWFFEKAEEVNSLEKHLKNLEVKGGTVMTWINPGGMKTIKVI